MGLTESNSAKNRHLKIAERYRNRNLPADALLDSLAGADPETVASIPENAENHPLEAVPCPETAEERPPERPPEPNPDPSDLKGWLAAVDAMPRSQRETLASDVLDEVFKFERMTFDDLGPLGAFVAYRVTRTWLFLTGQIAHEEPLAAKDVDWTNALPATPKKLRPIDRLAYARSLAAIEQHPAPVVPTACVNGTRAAWSTIVEAIATDLKAGEPSRQFPYASPRAVRLMSLHSNALRLWPTPAQVVEVEEELAHNVFAKLRDEGRMNTVTHVRETFGLSKEEAKAIVAISLETEQMLYRATPEQERALSIARAEEAIHRSRLSLDRRGEVIANKHVAIIAGLGRIELDDVNSDFRELAQKVAAPPQIPLRPAPKPPLDVDASPSKPAD